MTFADQTLTAFLASLSAKTPTPGGGAAAAVIAGVAAALGGMVVQYSRGKKGLAAYAALHEEAVTRLHAIATEALQLADEDAAAYSHLNALQKLPEQDERRKREWREAVEAAIAAPLGIMNLAGETLGLCERLTGRINEWLRSDLAIAAIAAEAAVASAAWNVRVNLPLLADESERGRRSREIDEALASARSRRDRIELACR